MLGLLVFILLAGCTVAADLVSDVKALRKNDRRTEIDVTPIVAKYIPPGTPQADAQQYLTKLGFKRYPHPVQADGLERVMLSRDESRLPFGFRDEIRVILTFTGGATTTVWGRLFYHSL
jgi:hypothetical protein